MARSLLRLLPILAMLPLASSPDPAAGFTRVSSSDAACTLVIGFSQTRSWFLDAPNFEATVENSAWELLWQGGAAIELWIDPDYIGWTKPLDSPCVTQPDNPERIVLTITGGSRPVSQWVEDILAAVATVRQKYPGAEEVLLQPVVGGPDHAICQIDTDSVRASVNHPVIDSAIAEIVSQHPGPDLLAGASPEVLSCADYRDRLGHLASDVLGPIGETIALFYLNPPAPDLTQRIWIPILIRSQ